MSEVKHFSDYPADRTAGLMAIPQWALDLGFEDMSWHNDAMARMELADAPAVQLWVAEENPSEREYPDLARFTVWTEVDGCTHTWLQTDDAEAVCSFLVMVPDKAFQRILKASRAVEAKKAAVKRYEAALVVAAKAAGCE